METYYTRKSYLQRIVNEKNLDSITYLEYEDFELIIQNNDYQTFHDIMEIAKENDLKFDVISKENFYQNFGTLIKITDHWLWIKEIPNFEISKTPYYSFKCSARTSTIIKLIGNDVSNISEMINITNEILDKYTEIEIDNYIKKLPNYDKKFYSTFDEILIYHLCGLYLSYSKKYKDSFQRIKKLFEI